MAINKVFEEGTFTTTTQLLTGPGTVTVEEWAGISTKGTFALGLTDGPWTAKINGFLASDNNTLALGGQPLTKNSSISIGTEGTVFSNGGGFAAILEQGAGDITNAGHIQAVGHGIFIDTSVSDTTTKGISIVNKAGATIEGFDSAITDEDISHALNIKNAGNINGGVAWAGALTLTNTGTISGTTFGFSDVAATAAASITNSGLIVGVIDFANGNDVLKNTGEITSDINFRDGNNGLTNGGMLFSGVTFGGGDDSMTNTGDVAGNVLLGIGKNTLSNGGSIDGNVIASVGLDVVKNTGTIGGNVLLGDGKDKVTNGGTIEGDLNTGADDDTVVMTGKVLGGIDLGAGKDSFTGGNAADQVTDGASSGDDSYKLGGGDDVMTTKGSGADLYDGGAGNDQFDVSGAGASILVNFDTKDVSVSGIVTKASSATLLLSVTTSVVKGFESVTGTGFVDVLVGGNAAESIHGGGGDDLIVGGGGADTLFGNAGADTFFYFKTTDSGPTRAKQDHILGFEGAGAGGGDIISLKDIDANTKQVNDQDFSFIGRDIAFGKHAGELRLLTDGGDTLVQGDVNGDGKADFSIAVIGVINLVEGDLVK